MNGRMKLARTIPEAVVTWAVLGPSQSETHNCGNFVFSYFISLQVLVLYRVRPPQPNLLSTCRWIVDDVLSHLYPLSSFFGLLHLDDTHCFDPMYCFAWVDFRLRALLNDYLKWCSICTYVCLYTRLCVCIYIHICVCAGMYTCTCAFVVVRQVLHHLYE